MHRVLAEEYSISNIRAMTNLASFETLWTLFTLLELSIVIPGSWCQGFFWPRSIPSPTSNTPTPGTSPGTVGGTGIPGSPSAQNFVDEGNKNPFSPWPVGSFYPGLVGGPGNPWYPNGVNPWSPWSAGSFYPGTAGGPVSPSSLNGANLLSSWPAGSFYLGAAGGSGIPWSPYGAENSIYKMYPYPYSSWPSHSYNPKTCICKCDINVPGAAQDQRPTCDWKMVFKAVKGSGRNVYDDWIAEGNMNINLPEAMDVVGELSYRNGDILDSWNQLYVQRVKVEIYSEGARRTWFYFDAIASHFTSWMEPRRLIASPYSDLKDGTHDVFSVAGEPSEEWRFLINRASSGCNGSCGYLMIVDPKSLTNCSFEQAAEAPFFLYSTVDSCSAWNDSSQYNIADRFVVSVKVCDVQLTPSESTAWEDPIPPPRPSTTTVRAPTTPTSTVPATTTPTSTVTATTTPTSTVPAINTLKHLLL